MKNKFDVLTAAIALLGVAWLVLPAAAAVVYVDATDGVGGNTTLVDGSQWDPQTADQGAAGDGLWARRGGSLTAVRSTRTPPAARPTMRIVSRRR